MSLFMTLFVFCVIYFTLGAIYQIYVFRRYGLSKFLEPRESSSITILFLVIIVCIFLKFFLF